jgi:Domain of unknown function (DUF4270)
LLTTLGRRQSISSSATANNTFIQSGTGLATKIEFPTLKSFFTNKNYILVDAALEITPVQNTYPASTKAPSTLAIYVTNESNVVLNKAPSFNGSGFLSANIVYDYEFGIKTKYSFPLINFLSSELKSSFNTITPLVIAAPPPSALTEINRVILYNQLTNNPQDRIKLKLYYSYVPNQ